MEEKDLDLEKKEVVGINKNQELKLLGFAHLVGMKTQPLEWVIVVDMDHKVRVVVSLDLSPLVVNLLQVGEAQDLGLLLLLLLKPQLQDLGLLIALHVDVCIVGCAWLGLELVLDVARWVTGLKIALNNNICLQGEGLNTLIPHPHLLQLQLIQLLVEWAEELVENLLVEASHLRVERQLEFMP